MNLGFPEYSHEVEENVVKKIHFNFDLYFPNLKLGNGS